MKEKVPSQDRVAVLEGKVYAKKSKKAGGNRKNPATINYL